MNQQIDLEEKLYNRTKKVAYNLLQINYDPIYRILDSDDSIKDPLDGIRRAMEYFDSLEFLLHDLHDLFAFVNVVIYEGLTKKLEEFREAHRNTPRPPPFPEQAALDTAHQVVRSSNNYYQGIVDDPDFAPFLPAQREFWDTPFTLADGIRERIRARYGKSKRIRKKNVMMRYDPNAFGRLPSMSSCSSCSSSGSNFGSSDDDFDDSDFDDDSDDS